MCYSLIYLPFHLANLVHIELSKIKEFFIVALPKSWSNQQKVLLNLLD